MMMSKLRKLPILLLVVLLPGAAAFAADVQSRTTAGVIETNGRTMLTQVDAVILVALEQAPILSRDDVVVTWRREGGIEPQPFRVSIPSGCFVEARDRFRVDGTRCGVRIILDHARLSTDVFAARLVPPDSDMVDDPYRLRIRLELPQRADSAEQLLSTLGGATVFVQIGTERGKSIASEIQSKSGISPTPF
jgi:hypothetical protein